MTASSAGARWQDDPRVQEARKMVDCYALDLPGGPLGADAEELFRRINALCAAVARAVALSAPAGEDTTCPYCGERGLRRMYETPGGGPHRCAQHPPDLRAILGP